MKQYGLSRSYYNEEMSSARTLDLLPRYTVSIAYKAGGYSNIPDIAINFSNSFSFAITKYTQLSRIVIIVCSNISPIVIKFIFQKTFITLFLHRL